MEQLWPVLHYRCDQLNAITSWCALLLECCLPKGILQLAIDLLLLSHFMEVLGLLLMETGEVLASVT